MLAIGFVCTNIGCVYRCWLSYLCILTLVIKSVYSDIGYQIYVYWHVRTLAIGSVCTDVGYWVCMYWCWLLGLYVLTLAFGSVCNDVDHRTLEYQCWSPHLCIPKLPIRSVYADIGYRICVYWYWLSDLTLSTDLQVIVLCVCLCWSTIIYSVFRKCIIMFDLVTVSQIDLHY